MRSQSLSSVVAVFAVIAGLSAPAAAQTALQLQQQAAAEAAGGAPFPLHAWISLTQNVGSGTFVASPFNPNVSSQLTLTPFLTWEGYTVLVNQSFGLEWTASELTTYANQIEMSDTSIAVRYTRLNFPELNLMLMPQVTFQVPISLLSRQAGSLGTPSAGARLIWNLPDVGASFYATGSTGFSILVPALSQRFAGEAGKPVIDDLGNSVTTQSCIVRSSTELLSYACGILPMGFRWSAGAGGSWSGFDNQLSVNLDVGYLQGFSIFNAPDDELKADAAVAGYGMRQFTSGNLSATYIPAGWVYLTAGLSTFQPTFQEDGTTPRFPLWDFVSPYNNLSSIYFDVTFAL